MTAEPSSMAEGPNASVRVLNAIRQWRDSLVNLTGRNRLLNYRPTRSSTIEFSRHTANDVYRIIESDELTFTMGTRPPEKPRAVDVEGDEVTSEELEQAALSQIHEFDFDSYPDHLFAHKTQRDVDRALRTLAGISKREFIDKGLRTLYVALGELRWKEDSGDDRRSPLLLIPAELDSLGPRERMFLKFSEDDIAVNPALALRLAEDYGLAFPSTEDVLATLETEGVDSVLDLFRAVKWPEEWEVRDFSALGVFMFAKEAMYRDLLDHEEAIAESALVQTLSGDISPEVSPFIFEPHGDEDIDEVAPPETTPLVLDADASQRAAVQAAVEGKSFTLDGPPGTGKSQTIANIIGGLIEAGKSVLFVSEKAVALDVVRDRLTESGLDPFLFELHSSKAVRKEVASRLGQALVSQPVPPRGMSSVKVNQLREARTALTEYVLAANEVREPLGASFHQVLGWLEQVRSEHVGPAFVGDARELSASTLATIESAVERIHKHWALHLRGDRATWHGLVYRGDTRFLLHRLASVLGEIQPILEDTKAVRGSFGLGTIDDLIRTATLLDRWHAEPSFHGNPWLDQEDFVALTSAVEDYERATGELDRAESEVRTVYAEGWEAVRPFPLDRIPELDADLLGLPGISRLATERTVVSAREAITGSLEGLARLERRSEELAVKVGAEPPRTAEAVRSLLAAVRACLSADAPAVEWCYNPEALSVARATADKTRNHQGALEQAERVASGVFTDKLLSIDLDSVEQLAEASRGFFKRFGAEHKALRKALSEISPAKWKVALDELPKARAWVDASQAYLTSASEASTVLAPYFKADRTTDWEQLRRRLENAGVVSASRFRVRSATERFLDDATAQTIVRDVVNSLDEAFIAWESEHQTWAAKVGEGDEDFQALESRLNDRARRLEPVIDIVSAQVQQLGATATLETHLEAAPARARYEVAAEAARSARDRLAGLARLDSVSVQVSSGDAGLARRKLEWARSVLTAVGRAGEAQFSLTSAQIHALGRSLPIPAASTVMSRYEELTEELVAWFDEERHLELREDLRDYSAAVELISHFQRSVEDVDNWFDLQRAVSDIDEVGLGPARRHAQSEALPESEVSNFLKATVYRGWLDAQLEDDERLAGAEGTDRDDLVKRFRKLDAELAGTAVAKIIEAGVARRPRTALGQAAIIRREAEKKRKHIPVRDLIDQARDAILAMHPCFMMSPLAVSQYLPSDKLFDVVIFDEASQVLPGDAINCIYRGSALIAAGDQKQLPPTSFFEATVDELDEDSEEDVANDFESILDLMKSSGSFTAQSLRWHYRSRHENLIAYSNSSFYDARLITFPGALDDSADAGVRFFRVPGVYRRSAGRDNPIEAKHVAERVIHHFSTRPSKSLGVVAFSTAQRDAIESAIELARNEHPDLDGYFSDDRAQGFFVKSLESVQGDERDVIIFSIGYGPDENGKVYRQFGPVSRKGGERRLNVAITRAKELVEVVSSMTAAEIGEVHSAGARHLRRYLDFAERGPSALELELGSAGLDTESPFEDSVVSYVRSLGFDVQPQVGVAGYRIDIGVKHPNQPGAFMLGIECDGVMYHSSRAARDRDRLRHQVLEGLGWHLHHIWGTAWYRHPEREKERLRRLLEEFASRPVAGRLTASKLKPAPTVTVEFVEQMLDEIPAWVDDYRVADTRGVPSDVMNYSPRLHELLDAVIKVESPIHFSVLLQRIRDHDGLERIGARMRQQVEWVIGNSKYDFDGEFIRLVGDQPVRVRRGTDSFVRTIEQVPEEELRHAVELLVADAIGISHAELVTRIANVFGWRRTGSDIRTRVESTIQNLLDEGALKESGAGLRPGATAETSSA